MVEADNVTSQAFLMKLKDFEEKERSLHPDLIFANSPNTFISNTAQGSIPSQPQIDEILANTPDSTGKTIDIG